MRRLVVGLIVLVVLAVGLDRASVWLAERTVAAKLARTGQVGGTPQVGIAGFPFLTQVAEGRYQEVTVDADDVRAPGGITATAVHLDLRGLRLPLPALLSGSVGDLPADSAAGWARVSYADLSRAVTAAVAGSPAGDVLQSVRFSAAGPGRLRMTGTAAVGGVRAQVSAVARLTFAGGAVRVRASPSDVTGLPGLGALDVTVPVPDLPYGVRLTALDVGGDGVTVSGRR